MGIMMKASIHRLARLSGVIKPYSNSRSITAADIKAVWMDPASVSVQAYTGNEKVAQMKAEMKFEQEDGIFWLPFERREFWKLATKNGGKPGPEMMRTLQNGRQSTAS